MLRGVNNELKPHPFIISNFIASKLCGHLSQRSLVCPKAPGVNFFKQPPATFEVFAPETVELQQKEIEYKNVTLFS